MLGPKIKKQGGDVIKMAIIYTIYKKKDKKKKKKNEFIIINIQIIKLYLSL